MTNADAAVAGEGSVPKRVMLVDDDALVRSGLRLMLGGGGAIEIVAEAVNGHDALNQYAANPVDLLLMDLRMPVLDGIAATAEFKKLPEPPAVIVLTTFDADDYVMRALAVGADGFLLKDTPPPEIVAAIDRVLAGQPALSPSVTASLIKQVVDGQSEDKSTRAAELSATLTERELEVAVCLARGSSNAEIASELFMGIPTVKAHISHIFTKLGASNRVQVAIVMHDAGLA